jgi:hypothetical protein
VRGHTDDLRPDPRRHLRRPAGPGQPHVAQTSAAAILAPAGYGDVDGCTDDVGDVGGDVGDVGGDVGDVGVDVGDVGGGDVGGGVEDVAQSVAVGETGLPDEMATWTGMVR